METTALSSRSGGRRQRVATQEFRLGCTPLGRWRESGGVEGTAAGDPRSEGNRIKQQRGRRTKEAKGKEHHETEKTMTAVGQTVKKEIALCFTAGEYNNVLNQDKCRGSKPERIIGVRREEGIKQAPSEGRAGSIKPVGHLRNGRRTEKRN